MIAPDPKRTGIGLAVMRVDRAQQQLVDVLVVAELVATELLRAPDANVSVCKKGVRVVGWTGERLSITNGEINERE